MSSTMFAILGRLTSDAESKNINDDKTITKFSIAVNRAGSWNQEENTYDAGFFDAECWNASEALLPYLTKGTAVWVSGELQQHKWQEDGKNRYRIIFKAHRIELASGGKGRDSNESSDETPEPVESARKGAKSNNPFKEE
jgi:single-strand DNA-binding protein